MEMPERSQQHSMTCSSCRCASSALFRSASSRNVNARLYCLVLQDLSLHIKASSDGRGVLQLLNRLQSAGLSGSMKDLVLDHETMTKENKVSPELSQRDIDTAAMLCHALKHLTNLQGLSLVGTKICLDVCFQSAVAQLALVSHGACRLELFCSCNAQMWCVVAALWICSSTAFWNRFTAYLQLCVLP